MLKRGMDRHDVARVAGLKPMTVSVILTGRPCGCRSRVLIENLFGPIWSTAAEVKKRQELAERIGFDPLFAKRQQLREAVQSLRIPGRNKVLRKADLIRLLETHFAEVKCPRGKRRGVVKSKSFSRGRECRKPQIERGK